MGLCSGPSCDRRAYAKGLCAAHRKQQKKHGRVYVIGDPEEKARISREAWDRLSPEQRATRVAAMQAHRKPRTAEHTRRQQESLRAAHAAGFNFTERECWGCGAEFLPASNHQFFCTAECRRLDARCRKHGITAARYRELLDAQGGSCGLCASEPKGYALGKGFVIDHCHLTGRVRGLLCGDCNTALGRFGDDPARLRAAIDYLERLT